MGQHHIAVVGAGWAGLAAATELQRVGHRVTVLELRHTPGGRARRLSRPQFQAPLDNGQHLLLGAYHATLKLMRYLDCAPEQKLWRQPLTLQRADGTLTVRAPRLPAPWHGVLALLSARGLNLGERLAAARFIWRLRQRRWHLDGTLSVSDLLHQHGQPYTLADKLWSPLCLAALNTPIQRACAQLFCHVLRDTLDGTATDSDFLIPRTDLSELWPTTAAARLDVRYGHQVRSLQPGNDDVWIDGATYDAAVLALPPYMASRLLRGLADSTDLCAMLNQFQYAPIATLTLQMSAPMPALPLPILMLREDPQRDHVGQWVFDRTRLLNLDPQRPELTVVTSQCDALQRLTRAELTRRLHTQLAEQIKLPPVAAAELILEKRATFEATPGLQRPQHRTPWRRLVLAGDYTDTGYPAVLEGAVRSGLAAADALLESMG